jgi:hypothetical protein
MTNEVDDDLDDDKMTAEEEAKVREKAAQRCGQWNWNANVPEIAKELMDEDMDPDSREFEIYGEEFVKFFSTGEPRAEDFWGICKQIMETFA